MTEDGEWPAVARFLLGAVVGGGISFVGGVIAATSTPWLVVLSVLSAVFLGLLSVVFGSRLWEVFLP